MLSAGCTSPENLPGTTSPQNKTAPTPTPGHGSVTISPDLWSAGAYPDDDTDLLHRRVNSLLRSLRREETGAERHAHEAGGYGDEGRTSPASGPVQLVS